MTLPTTTGSFMAINDRPWLVRFWELDAYWIGIAFPFGLILFILFYFDHNVSVRGPLHRYSPCAEPSVPDCSRLGVPAQGES
jgi:hypothetical protein